MWLNSYGGRYYRALFREGESKHNSILEENMYNNDPLGGKASVPLTQVEMR